MPAGEQPAKLTALRNVEPYWAQRVNNGSLVAIND